MATKESEGLIPVEAPQQHQAVSPLSPHPTDGINTVSTISPEPTGPAPSYEKSQQLHDASNEPAEPAKAYQGQPPTNQAEGGFVGQHPVNSPSDLKSYPGQPIPQGQGQAQAQPGQYYTPYGQPSGYATATPLHALQSAPAPVDCPCCGRREMTRTEAVSGGTTHGWAAVLCFCCCLGCIPYLMSSLKDVDHYCGKCGAKLACWHNSGRVVVMQNGARR